MKLTRNKILITGGSSGIGLVLAREFLRLGNKVIICGRSEEKLKLAKQNMPELVTYSCDLSKPRDIDELCNWIEKTHADVNVVINNAAIAHKGSLVDMDGSALIARQEFDVNILAPIQIAEALLKMNKPIPLEVILNINTGLAFAPRADYSFYNATKSALHAFTRVLRHQLKDKGVEVIEVFYPVVDTPWHKGNTPKIAITAEQAVLETLAGLRRQKSEIYVGKTKIFAILSRISPKLAFKLINQVD